MRVDHVFDRLVGDGADGLAELRAHLGAAGRIDHGDAVAADNKTGIGNVAPIVRRLHLVAALVDEDARRHFAWIDRGSLRRVVAQKRGGRERQRRAKEVAAGQGIRPASASGLLCFFSLWHYDVDPTY